MRGNEGVHSSGVRIWSGRVLIGLAALFMLFDGAMKIVKPPQVMEATARLAYPLSALSGIGIALIACTAIYLVPRTRIVGAVLLTGYLGGAVASNVRAGNGWFETLFPMLFAAVVWAGVGLSDGRVGFLLAGKGAALVAQQ